MACGVCSYLLETLLEVLKVLGTGNQCGNSFDCCNDMAFVPTEGPGCLGHLFIHPSLGFVKRLGGIGELLVDFTSLKRLLGKWMWLKQSLGISMNEHLVKIKYYCNKKAKCKVAHSQEMPGDTERMAFCAEAAPAASTSTLTRLYRADSPYCHCSASPQPHLNSSSLDIRHLLPKVLTSPVKYLVTVKDDSYTHVFYLGGQIAF